MKIIRKMDVFIVLFFLVIIGLYIVWHLWNAIPTAYRYDSRVIKNSLLYFIDQNDGKLPLGKQELIDKGFLDVVNDIVYLKFPDSYKYEGGDDEPKWHRCLLFESFTIRYGTEREFLTITDKTLYLKNDKKQASLISGPYDFFVPYGTYSFDLYWRMENETGSDDNE